MKKVWNSFKAAVFTYSIIPTPKFSRKKEDLQYVLYFVPLVGILIQFLFKYWKVGAPYLFNYTLMTAAVCAVLPNVLSKASTLDGFFRTVDALSSHKTVEDKLQILNDSHGGYSSIITCVCYFLVCVGVWSEIDYQELPLMGYIFVVSRALYVLSILTFKHTKESKCSAFVPSGSNRIVMIFAMVAYLAYSAYRMWVLNPKVTLAMGVGALLSYLFYYISARRHFGGITEDIAGFFVHVCELVMPVAALIAYRLLLGSGSL